MNSTLLYFCILISGIAVARSHYAAASADPLSETMEGPRLLTGVLENVDATWNVVSLPRSYQNMVVIGVPQYEENQPPAVVRVRNAGDSSFEIRVQNPSGEPLEGYTVHYVVVESGAYTLEEHGINMEAFVTESSITDHSTSWQGEPIAYTNDYVDPVIFGQVMSFRDERWSVFWARGYLVDSPPGAMALIGKHVGEDDNVERENELIGYIVIESGSGTLPGFSYQAFVGEDIVSGVGNSPPYVYDHSLKKAEVAIVSVAGLGGANGGWPILWGKDPISDNDLDIAFEEDQIGDSERRHTTERVATLLLDKIVLPPLIDAFQPTAGPPGTEVFITGERFFEIQEVIFNDKKALSFEVLSENQIRAIVPEDAASGPIRVKNSAGESQTTSEFEVIPSTFIGSIDPTHGEAGSVVQMSGAGFQEVDRVVFEGNIEAGYDLISDSEIVIDVPEGARTGFIRVFNTAGVELMSPAPFVVTFQAAHQGMNLCRLTDAVQSQSSLATFFADPRKACDGILFGTLADESFTSTIVEQSAWWEADLGAVYEIEAVTIRNRSDCCKEELANFFVFISDDPFLSKSVDITLADPEVSAFLVGEVGDSLSIDAGRTGRYVRLQHIGQGSISLSEVDVVAASGRIVDVSAESQIELPGHVELHSIYPSPVRGRAAISYRLPEPGVVRIVLYDILGRQIQVLVDSFHSSGNFEVHFSSSSLRSGHYFCRLESEGKSITRGFTVTR